MLNYLPDLIKNPLIITGVLMALAIIIYFSLEHRHIIHKTKRERALIILGWGFFLAIIALISLFTTSLNILAKSAGILSEDLAKEQYTLDKANRLCSDFKQELSPEYIKGCEIIGYFYYGAYSTLGLSVLLLIIGFFKRIGAIKEEVKGKILSK